MSLFTRRRSATGLLLVPLAALLAGCGQQPAAPGTPPVQAAPPLAAAAGPAEIELSDPKVTLADEKTVRFEVKYRFTKGRPAKYYMCEVSFPGTANQAFKEMQSWELKSEGAIKDGIELSQQPVQRFEIRVSEADSPQLGYKTISNVVSGTVK